MVGQADFTKPLLFQTNVPAPKPIVNYNTNKTDPPSSGNIQISACSELVEYAASTSVFSAGGRLESIQGFQGEPIIFAIGPRKRLNCLAHESGTSQGWNLYDISPSGDEVVAFGVLQVTADKAKNLEAGVSVVAATRRHEDGTSQVHTAFIPGALLDKTAGTVTSPWKGLSWTTLADPKGGKEVTTIYIGSIKSRQTSKSPFIIWVGTRERGQKAATFYAIDPTPGVADPWVSFAPDTSADEVLNIQPASVESRDGLFVFSEKEGRSECIMYAVSPDDLKRTSITGTLQGDLGKVNAVYSSRNPWQYTDLVVACEQGVGFINFKTLGSKPIPVSGLPKVSFRDVVCSEKVDPQNKQATAITIFAVSEDNDLYYVQGNRRWSDGFITFSSSGLPIRTNVERISGRYNPATNSSELVYTGSGVDQVKHLIRDPVTSGWSESSISFSAPNTVLKFSAFVTSISLRDAIGRSVGENFPVQIKADSMHVLANENSYCLSAAAARTIRTDSQGQIVLVSQASSQTCDGGSKKLSLNAPVYNISISRDSVSYAVDVQAGQRVSEKFQGFNTASNLAGARSTTGEAIFGDDALGKHKVAFEQGAGLLKETSKMLQHLSGESSLEAAKTEKEAEVADDGGFLEAVGDAVEWLRNTTKKVLKATFKVVMQGIKFVLTIGGKILSFIVKTAGQVLSVVGNFLEDVLGIDFKQMFKMLGILFDPEKTKTNQKILEKSIKTLISLPGTLIKSNADNLDNLFNVVEKGLEPYLGSDTNSSVGLDPDEQLKNSSLYWLLDNPVLRILKQLNPLSILTEALAEAYEETGLDEYIQIPQMSKYLTPAGNTIWDSLKAILAQFLTFLEGLWADISDTVANPSIAMQRIKKALQKGFSFLFGAIKTLVKAAWKALGEVFDALVLFLEAKWKIPLITPLFEWYAEQDFTIMNVLTFMAARVMGIVVGDDRLAKLIDPGPEFESLTAAASSTNLFSLQSQRMDEKQFAEALSAAANQTRDYKPPASGLSTNAIPSHGSGTEGTKSSSAQKVADKNKPYANLSDDAKDRLHKYHNWGKSISIVVSIPRLFSIYLEVTHIMVEGGLAPKAQDHATDGPHLAIPLMSMVMTAMSAIGSVAHIVNAIAAWNYSTELEVYLDHSIESVTIGSTIGLVLNSAAFSFSIVSFLALRNGENPFSKECAIISGLALTVGSCGETVGVHLIPGFVTDEPAAVQIVLASLEVVGNIGGFTSILAAAAKEPTTTFIGAGVDGVCTLLTGLTGILMLVGEDNSHKHSH